MEKKQLILILFLVGINYHEAIFTMEQSRPAICLDELQQVIHDLRFPSEYITFTTKNLCMRSPDEFFQPEDSYNPTEVFSGVIEYVNSSIQKHRSFNTIFLELLFPKHYPSTPDTIPENLLAPVYQSAKAIQQQQQMDVIDRSKIIAQLHEIGDSFVQVVSSDNKNIKSFFEHLERLIALKGDQITCMDLLFTSFFPAEQFIPARGAYGDIVYEKTSVIPKLSADLQKKYDERLAVHESTKKQIQELIRTLAQSLRKDG